MRISRPAPDWEPESLTDWDVAYDELELLAQSSSFDLAGEVVRGNVSNRPTLKSVPVALAPAK